MERSSRVAIDDHNHHADQLERLHGLLEGLRVTWSLSSQQRRANRVFHSITCATQWQGAEVEWHNHHPAVVVLIACLRTPLRVELSGSGNSTRGERSRHGLERPEIPVRCVSTTYFVLINFLLTHYSTYRTTRRWTRRFHQRSGSLRDLPRPIASCTTRRATLWITAARVT